MSSANTSQHLQVLRSAGLVDSSRDGTYIVYRLAGELVWGPVRCLRQVVETHLAEVDRALAQLRETQHALEPVDREKFTKLAAAEEIIVLDVRRLRLCSSTVCKQINWEKALRNGVKRSTDYFRIATIS